MNHSISNGGLATEGNDVATCFQADGEMETGGKKVAIACLHDAIEESGVPRKVLASECAWSEGQFSKVASGAQGDILDLVYRLPRTRAGIRADFFHRLTEHEQIDPIAVAAEQAAIAAIRLIRVVRSRGRMAKAGLPTRARRVSA